MPRIFLSFATEDYDFVILFFNRLKKLELEIWDYSRRDDEIPLGEEIKTSLAREIMKSDYFIPIVSCNSVKESKDAVQFEVKYAIDMKKVCYPVVISTRKPAIWTGSFTLLAGKRYLDFDPANTTEFEQSIHDLCDYLGVRYEPVNVDPARLPLSRAFDREIEHTMTDIRNRRQLFKYDQLLSLINKFNLYYSQGKWDDSLEKIDLLIAYNKENLLISDLYYPLIVKGACELELNRLEAAEKTFIQASRSPRCDENAYGGLGQVYFRQNDWESALSQYNFALSVCPPGKDAEIIYNILLTAVEALRETDNTHNTELISQAHLIVNNSDYLHKVMAMPDARGKDRWDVEYLVGLAYTVSNRMTDAYSSFSQLYETPILSVPDEAFSGELNSGSVAIGLHTLLKTNGFQLPVGTPVCSPGSAAGQIGTRRRCRWIISSEEQVYYFDLEGQTLIVHYCELSLIINFAQILESKGRKEEAGAILEEEAEILNSRLLFHHYASLLARMLDLERALQVYEDHLANKPYDKQFLVEYALLLKRFNRFQEMKKACTLAIASGFPKDQREFYYQGYAYFLLGRSDSGRGYFDDSGPYSDPYV